MTASTSPSLIDLIMSLLKDPTAHAAFTEDPAGWLASCGAGSVTPDDIHDALVLVSDKQDGDFSRDYHTGGNHISVPPPPAPHPGESGHETAVRYLNNYVTNNYIDDRDTIIDQSVNQNINTHGGDFDQEIDNHSVNATGDGAVAAGGDIKDSTVVTGHDNMVGDGNIKGDNNVLGNHNAVVNGDGNTTSFGSGDATSTHTGAVTVGDGGAFNTGSGSTSVNNSDNSLHDVGNTLTDNSQTNSHNTAVDASQHDSNNDSSDHSQHTDTHTEDSGNTDIDASQHSNTDIDHSIIHPVI
ncbi:IniB N-terminal domain-containing protein [Pseudonocardia sp. GCM10023141]|uniref:IniB N-terminal domain-containing protein n=1 Tax=Pseudonocardia sp. GCM10023141 TaxID=3252653 RepID=UPI00361D1BDB